VADQHEWAQRNTVLDHLERRRAALDAGLWQAPALTLAAQAFLLRVLVAPGVHWAARLAILLAGVTASIAAAMSLVRSRAREVEYSDALAAYFADFGLPEIRTGNLPKKSLERDSHWQHRFDQWLQARSQRGRIPMYVLWGLSLVLFAIADVVAFITAVC
jgi:hypothetical protein